MGAAQFPYDTAGGSFASLRSRLYAEPHPLDIRIASLAAPSWWNPNASESPSVVPIPIGAQSAKTPDGLLAVPAIGVSCVILCAVETTRLSANDRLRLAPQMAWLSTNYLLEHFRRFPLRDRAPSSLLSPQEERVIQLCREGLTDKEIGKVLGISPHTVRTHLNNAKQKLEARNKTHAVHLYERNLLLQAD